MTTVASPLLGLALPIQGELSGTWGDVVNNSITSLLETAVAGITTLSTDADVTLSTTNFVANQARAAILACTGARTALRTITAPAQSKVYFITNATTGGYDVKLVGAGPTTGVTIGAGRSAVVVWNGSDFILLAGATITSPTGSLTGTFGTTAQRDASPAAGYIRGNSSTNAMEWYNGASWATVGGGATGAGTDTAFVENDCVVTTSYTLGQGALVAGVTVTIASPAVCTLTNHGFVAGQQIRFSTTGALPTGLDASAAYYVIAAGLTASTFEVSTTYAGTAVTTTGTQSGVHSVGKIKNAESAGPLTVLDSTTVTIPSGASWSIV